MHPADSWWRQSKLVSMLGCSFCTEKKSSAAPAIARCFCNCCAGETGRYRAPSWVGCPLVTAAALRDLVLGWYPSLQASWSALGHGLPPSWRGLLWCLTASNALCCRAWDIWHLTVMHRAAIAEKLKVLPDDVQHRKPAAACAEVCQPAACWKQQDNVRGTRGARFHPGFELCLS